MGARRQRAEAVSKLKDALTRQFGDQSRSIVEASVDAHLGGGKGQIGRQDLDVIEKGILASMRQQRGSTKTLGSNRLSKSAPFLPTASSMTASTQEATVGAFAPPRPSPTPKLPIGTSNPGATARSSSMGSFEYTKPKKPRRPAPYGLSITGGSEFVDESARSGVKLQARYPVPKPPLLKPMDHWDLIVAFDSAKYRFEEKMLEEKGHHERMMSFKKTLDDQMLEVQEGRDNEERGRQEERELMLAQMEENKKYAHEEEAIIQRKRDEQSKINTMMLDTINKYKKKEADRKQKECDEMTKWLEAEKNQRDEDERNQRIEYARKCEAAKKMLDEQRELREENRRLDDENEKRLMRLRDQIQDEQEAKKQKALQDRKDHLDRVAKTLGAAVAGRDAQEAAELDAKIKKIQEDANRASMEDNRRRQETHNAKVKNMVEVRKQQAEEKRQREAQEKQEGMEDLSKFTKAVEDMNREEREKEEKRRKAREAQDGELIAKIRINAGIHPHHVMMTPRNRKTELGYNKAIFEQMTKEGFMVDRVQQMYSNPEQRDHHPEGKLTAFPTIPRYTGEIHPIELEQPDV